MKLNQVPGPDKLWPLSLTRGASVRRPGVAYGATLAALVAALALRWLLDPVLGDHLPLVTLFGAVAAAVWLGGYRPALLAVMLGYLACDYLFIDPRFRIGFSSARSLVGLIAYLVTCSLLIGFGEALRLAQRRAGEGRELLRVTLASIGDAVITTDTDGRITYLNAVAESLTGWRQEEAAGQPIEAVFRIANEETKLPAESPVTQALREGVVVGLANHTSLLAKDGKEWSIDDSAAPIKDAGGRVVGVVLVFRDVSQRRQAERLEQNRLRQRAEAHEEMRRRVEELEKLMEVLPVAVWIARDRECMQISGNRAGYHLLRMPSGLNLSLTAPLEEQPTGFRVYHAGQEVPPEELPLQRAAARGIEVRDYEEDIVFDDGTVVQAFGSALPLFDEKGEVRGSIAAFMDVSELGRLEQELRRKVEELAVADRRKNEFLATLAHELRNPLAAIRNAAQILSAKGPPDPDLRWSRGVILRQVSHMARLLDDLLDLSRISQNKLDLRKERTELAAAFEMAVETSRPLIESGGHELIVNLPSEPVYLDADPVRLSQVFSNLLQNAAKYSDAGGNIRLAGELQGSEVLVSVKDDGIGISAETLPRIFEMFSQGQRVLERSQDGLGIGLALVRGLVGLHGGSIEARSDGPGQGSEFVVRLPRLVPPAVEMRERSGAGAGPMHAAPRRRLLIVDDLKDNADTLAMLLELKGHEVHMAYDGEEAIAAAERFQPEVVLLDIGMPKLDGYEACRHIRQQPWGKEMFLIALTGWGQDDDRRRTEEAGFDHHLVKPADPAVLLQLLASLPAEPEGLGFKAPGARTAADRSTD